MRRLHGKRALAQFMSQFAPDTKFSSSVEYTSGTWWTETYSANGREVLRVSRQGLGCTVWAMGESTREITTLFQSEVTQCY